MVAITGEAISPHEVQLHMIKEAGARGVANPSHVCPAIGRERPDPPPPYFLTPRRHCGFPSFVASLFHPLILGAVVFLPLLYLRPCGRRCFCLYRKPQHEQRKEQEPKRPHIKKPLNAFMLYMKEMRANVVAECTLKESAAINQILGRRVGAATCLSLWHYLILSYLCGCWVG